MQASKKPVMLLILDGFGHREPAPDNAISAAKAPNWQRIWAKYPRTLIRTDGLAVGLPDGQMGNSEVGHMNLGAGRVVFQELTRINLAIESGDFYKNPALLLACEKARSGGGFLHLMILLSDGGVHSHVEHLIAMLKLAEQEKVSKVAVHAFLDGRDTPPRSAKKPLEDLHCAIESYREKQLDFRIVSVCGRYYAMDRDQRWERVERAWRVIVDNVGEFNADTVEQALDLAYARGENDEFVLPTRIGTGAPMRDGDAVVYMNFRADRARALTQAFVQADFPGFSIAAKPKLSGFITLTEYAKSLPVTALAYAPQSMQHTLPEILAERGMTQLRIAETEKYAHVTFFFNGGVESPYPGEQRILVPSPKVATYDLQPQMSCPEVTEKLEQAIASQQFDVIVCNIANPDMVGHTGIFAAAVQAVEAVDVALGKIEKAILQVGGQLLITADHGNLEEMWDHVADQANTQHSTNPVPLVLIGHEGQLRESGTLADVAPTLLDLLRLPKPEAMTGRSLLQ